MDATLLQNVALIAGTVIVVGLGLAAINFARREIKGSARSEEGQLAQFQAAYDAGEMDTGEFRRVSESLRRRGERPSDRPHSPPRPAPPTEDRPAGESIQSPPAEGVVPTTQAPPAAE